MIDIRKLKELVRLMVANDLTELDLRDSEEQVTLRRPSPMETPQVVHHTATHASPTVHPAHANGASATSAQQPPEQAASGTDDGAGDAGTEGLVAIESPMVGTFYATPDPDSPPFVKVGDQINPDSVVCLVEAMKIFNEIKAEVSGTIEKICVKSGDAIEFGEQLFLVRPD